ncbi:MAG: glycyl-radical enzyme activating protein [Clostridia bacterium]|nr:glycyl-radical enzyme activating protein [Clostridia bacterium]
MAEPLTGIYFNIQRFSLHDGPGIRDLIFLKGCPLRCAWCANPESQSPDTELSYRSTQCIGCHACLSVCPTGALSAPADGGVRVDRARCRRCFSCVKSCCSEALSQIGERVTPGELFRRVTAQHKSWRSEAGITVSGGEPLSQPAFTAELLRLFHESGVHTALETCGCAPFSALEAAAPYCEMVFFDLKLMDSARHRRWTGAGNEEILENLRLLSRRFPALPVVVRTPLIRGVNDDMENLTATVEFLKDVKSLRDYELLPYHNWGEDKYRQLGRDYSLKDVSPPNKAEVAALNDRLRAILWEK